MLAPAVRNDSPLPTDHPCAGCDARTAAVCGVLECEKLSGFRKMGTQFRLATGQPLFHEGDPATRVYTVTRGSLKLYKLLPDGRRQVTGFMQPGDFLGISVDDEHAFSAEALEPSQLCGFPRNRFDDFTEDNGEMERELYRLAVHELAAAQQQMVLLGRKTAAERLASFFLALADREERASSDKARFVSLPMSRSDIADYLGLTKETISRVLSQFKSRRVIRLDAINRIEILDREALEALAAGEA
ncbi:MAG TPA: helix-turn-helix domain-containing protein [Sphingomicrobium sp.]|nr:helix-turn-helix domain-containing protein [Sphingomicrobium sp.]